MDLLLRGLPRLTRAGVVLAAVAALVALLPGLPFAVAAVVLAALAALLAGLGLTRREPPVGAAIAAGLAGLLLALVCLPSALPLPSPERALATSVEATSARWRSLLRDLDAAVRTPPLAGGDFHWVQARRDLLGPGSGLAVLEPRDLMPLAWSGWTTRPTERERDALVDRLDDGPALLVLRRGLTLRLLYARVSGDDDRLAVVAEVPLPSEPDAGRFAPGAELGVEARVRWQALGEGLRAAAEPLRPDRDAVMHSLVPLMAGREQVAGLVSLAAQPTPARRADREDWRQAGAGVLIAAALAIAAARRCRWCWLLPLPARLALLAEHQDLARRGPLEAPAPWLALLPDDAPWWLLALVDTPADAALSGLALLAMVALAPRPATKTARWAHLVGGLLAVALGLGLVAAVTRESGLGGFEVLLPHAAPWAAGAAAFALTATVWAGLLGAARTLRGPSWAWFIAAGAGAGLLAGGAQALAVTPGARRAVEREIVPEVRGRLALWRDALAATLDLAIPPPDRPGLAPERDAIDLWWRSPLGRLGLASGVWKFSPRGELEDVFVSGLPPVEPVPLLVARPPGPDPPPWSDTETPPTDPLDEEAVGALEWTADDEDEPMGPFPRVVAAPEPRTLRFVGGDVDLLAAEVRRPEGGSWLVAVLAAAGNLPSRSRTDPLRGAQHVSPMTSALSPSPGLTPYLAWFDAGGNLVDSDLEASPPPPRAPPRVPRWRTMLLEGRRAVGLEIPDPGQGGTVVAIFFPPTWLTQAAVALGWAALGALLGVALTLARRLLVEPLRLARRVGEALRRVGTHFRVQLAVILVVAGLIPLLTLGWVGRAVAHRNARQQLVSEGARAVLSARRFVEDYLAESGALTLDDAVTSWLARTLGSDLFVWEEGELLATSRPDLVRAGLWPERIRGEVFTGISVERRSLVVATPPRAGPGLPEPYPAVVHGPYAGPGGQLGVLSLPLARVGTRIEQEQAAFDRALLVSAVLLVALTGLLLTPTTRRLVRPLVELEQATSRIAGGRFEMPVPRTGYEETRALARAFREMARSLAAQRASLERRRAAMEALIATMPVAVVTVRSDGTIWAANPPARELLGAEAGSPLPAGGSALAEAVAAMAGEPDQQTRGVELPEAEGRRSYRVTTRDLPALQAGEQLRLVVVEDLTDAVRSQRLAAWAEMARRIAHEIKNPLTPISLVVEHARRVAAEKDPRLPEVLDRCLDTIAEQVGVLRETAREFNDYARLLVARPEPLQLGRELPRWLAPFTVAPPAGVRLELDGPNELPVVPADPRLIRRAVVNLVDNALAAVAGSGTVRVSWAYDDGADPSIRITVADDGPGIPEALLPELFEPDVTTRETGSGLGLPIARQAVEAHGGRISLETGAGWGTRFTIHLPVREAATTLA